MAVTRHATRPLWAGFSLLILAVPLALNAAVGVSVNGFVSDTSGAPIQGVSVVSLETGMTAFSDANGRFELSDLPLGQHYLSLNRLGYYPRKVGPITTYEGSPASIQVRLTSKTITLPQVDIHNTRHPGVQLDGITATVTQLDWSASGARTVGDALRLIPSVTIREDSRAQRISLRGSPPRAVQVDLDGVPLNDPGTGEADVSSVPLHQLATVEVELSGNGGKVHLLSRSRKTMADIGQSGGVGSSVGSQGRIEGELDLKKEGAEWGMHLRGGSSRDDGDFSYRLDDGTRKKRYNNAERKQSGDAGFSWSRPGSRIETDGYYSRVDRGIPGLIYAAPTPEAEYKTSRIAGRIAFRRSAGFGGFEALVHAQSQEGEFYSPAHQYDPVLGDTVYNLPEWSRQSAERYGSSASLELPVASVDLSVRYGWQLDRFIGRDLFTGRVNVGGVGYGKAERQTHHLEAGGKNQWKYDRWDFSLAPLVAGDFIEDKGLRSSASFSPSILVAARRPGDDADAMISLGWSRSITPPPFNALFTVESMVAAGNRNLKPERGESLVMNAIVEPKIQNWDSEASVSLFRRETADFIVWKRNSWGKYYPENLGAAQFTGAEVSGRIEPSGRGTALWFNYIYNNSRNVTPGDVNNGNYIPLTPLHSGSSGVTFTHANSSITLQGRWVGRSYSSESNFDPISTAGMGLPKYSVYDLSAHQSIPFTHWKITVEVGVDNLLDRSYRVIERSPMPGRGYWGKLSVEVK